MIKKTLTVMFLCILLVGTVSAWDWDNVKSYDSEKETVTIVNALGLGSDIAEMKLVTPKNNLVGIGYVKVAEFKVNSLEDYNKPVGKMDFYNLRENWKEMEKEFDYKYLVNENVNVDVYGNVVVAYTTNGTEILERKVVGTRKEMRSNWYDLNINDFYKGELTIGIFTDVKEGEYVEWIPTLFGVKIGEWASWQQSYSVDLVSFWEFNTDGDAEDSYGGNHATDVYATFNASSFLNGGYEFNGSATIAMPNVSYTDDEFTWNVWVRTDGSASEEFIFSKFDANTRWELYKKNTGSFAVVFDSTSEVSTVIDSLTNISNNEWHMLTARRNSTNAIALFVDAVEKTSTILAGDGDIAIGADNVGTRSDGTLKWNGSIDELSVWNRSLTSAEITAIYNSGAGLEFIGNASPVVSISSPVNTTNTTNPTISFIGVATDNLKVQNVTLILNDVYNTTNSSPINNSNTIFIKTLGDGLWKWKYSACDNDSICGNSTEYHLLIDTIAPTIFKFSPIGNQGVLSDGDSLNIKFLVTETNPQACFYDYNGTNMTIPCTSNSSIIYELNRNSLRLWANDTSGHLNSTVFNWTYSISINANIYNTSTYEMNTEDITVNISYIPSDWSATAANLVYNDVSYTGTKQGSGSSINFTRQLDIPLLNATVNTSFYWNFQFTNSSGTFFFNSTALNQTVNEVLLLRCNGTYYAPIFTNFTNFDEEKLKEINATMKATFDYWLGDGSVFKTYSLDDSSSQNTTYHLCTNYNGTFYVDSKISLNASGYHNRMFWINNKEYNYTHTILHSLYLLNSSVGTQVIVQVRDSGLVPVESNFIKIYRYYPEDNTYRVVIHDKTDEYGQILTRLIESPAVKYQFEILDEDNNVRKRTGDMTVACRSVICVLPIVIEDTTDDFGMFENETDYDWTFSFSDTTNIFTFSWNDVSGLSAKNRLYVERILWNGTSVVCNTTSTSKSGSLTCSVGAGDASYTATIYRTIGAGDEKRLAVLREKVGVSAETFGREGLVWGFILTMTMIALGVWFPPIGIIFYMVGWFIFAITGIVQVNSTIYIAQLILGIIAIWAFVGGKKR